MCHKQKGKSCTLAVEQTGLLLVHHRSGNRGQSPPQESICPIGGKKGQRLRNWRGNSRRIGVFFCSSSPKSLPLSRRLRLTTLHEHNLSKEPKIYEMFRIRTQHLLEVLAGWQEKKERIFFFLSQCLSCSNQNRSLGKMLGGMSRLCEKDIIFSVPARQSWAAADGNKWIVCCCCFQVECRTVSMLLTISRAHWVPFESVPAAKPVPRRNSVSATA